MRYILKFPFLISFFESSSTRQKFLKSRFFLHRHSNYIKHWECLSAWPASSSDSHTLESEDEITRSGIFAISFTDDLLLYKNHDCWFRVRGPWHEMALRTFASCSGFQGHRRPYSLDYFFVFVAVRVGYGYALPCLKGLAWRCFIILIVLLYFPACILYQKVGANNVVSRAVWHAIVREVHVGARVCISLCVRAKQKSGLSFFHRHDKLRNLQEWA